MAKPHRDARPGAPPGNHMRPRNEGNYVTNKHGAEREKIPKQQPLNEQQLFMYDRVLYGLGMYDKEEVALMHPDKKKRILKVQRRAQTLINLWKQRIVIELSNYLFVTIFPDSPITKELVEKFSEPDELFINRMPLRKLKITRQQLIDRFIKEGILPKNFYQLNPKENASRDFVQRGRSDDGHKSINSPGGRVTEIIS